RVAHGAETLRRSNRVGHPGPANAGRAATAAFDRPGDSRRGRGGRAQGSDQGSRPALSRLCDVREDPGGGHRGNRGTKRSVDNDAIAPVRVTARFPLAVPTESLDRPAEESTSNTARWIAIAGGMGVAAVLVFAGALWGLSRAFPSSRQNAPPLPQPAKVVAK